jgi:Leucine-rich repeat (LRR) protein
MASNVLGTLQMYKFIIFSEYLVLEEIHLSNNRITSLDPNTFNNLPNLKLIELSRNQITSLDPNSFNNIRIII